MKQVDSLRKKKKVFVMSSKTTGKVFKMKLRMGKSYEKTA